MKSSRRQVRGKAHVVPVLKFESQPLISSFGLVVFQQLFAILRLKARLAACLAHQAAGKVFARPILFLQLVLHVLLGYRESRDSRGDQDDPLVERVLGLRRLPDVARLSRMLTQAEAISVENLRRLLRELVVRRLGQLALPRITLDFDGSVPPTMRHAEGTAVGSNKKKRGARSYDPLFCTIAQTSQVLDFLHRSGKVHESHGAGEFLSPCIQAACETLPGVIIEVRMDSAFFSDEIVLALDAARIEFSVSVPFQRCAELKKKIEGRKRWRRLGDKLWHFMESWKPKVRQPRFRFLFLRTLGKHQQQGPIQLDLFLPCEYGYDFKVVVTNKRLSPRKVAGLDERRGSQEGGFGELKRNWQMGYVPVRKCLGNPMDRLAGLFAHNLLRELQMMTTAGSRQTTENRTPLWASKQPSTFRAALIQRAGRFTRPHGNLTLTVSASHWIKTRLLDVLKSLQNAA